MEFWDYLFAFKCHPCVFCQLFHIGHYPLLPLKPIVIFIFSLTLNVKRKKKRVFLLQYQSMRLSDVHRKAQLWRGIVSISLIEGRRLKPMDANGLSDPYVKFRMGHQKYKSKVDTPTLVPGLLLIEMHVK